MSSDPDWIRRRWYTDFRKWFVDLDPHDPNPENWPDAVWQLHGPEAMALVELRSLRLLSAMELRSSNFRQDDVLNYLLAVTAVRDALPPLLDSVSRRLDQLYRDRLHDFLTRNNTDPSHPDGAIAHQAISFLSCAVTTRCISSTLFRHIHAFNLLFTTAINAFYDLASAFPSSPALSSMAAAIHADLCTPIFRLLDCFSMYTYVELHRRMVEMIEPPLDQDPNDDSRSETDTSWATMSSTDEDTETPPDEP